MSPFNMIALRRACTLLMLLSMNAIAFAQELSPRSDIDANSAELDDDEQIAMRLRSLTNSSDESEMTIGAQGLSTEELDTWTNFPGGLGVLPSNIAAPADNDSTIERVELGKMLFFDKRLSRDQSISCATCHDPSKGWSDGLPLARGYNGKELGRHSPTIINSAFHESQFWDGRSSSLEQQALGPILAEGEMNMPNPEAVLNAIANATDYKGRFERAYGTNPTWESVGKAIAAFERTIISGPSRFDQYVLGDKAALSESEKRGLILFTTKASCTACHKGPNFTDHKFHSVGLRESTSMEPDVGRFMVTQKDEDRGCFKTPGLRNIEQSAPYMHNGSLSTLEEVVEFYDKGGENSSGRSKLIRPLRLTVVEKADLVAFLKALTGKLPVVSSPIEQHEQVQQ